MPVKQYWFICLIVSYILATFPLQPVWLIDKKKYLRGKILHACIQSILAYLLCGQWYLWSLPVIILIFYTFIDFIPKENYRLYLLDQVLRLGVIITCIYLLPFPDSIIFSGARVLFLKVILVIGGVFALTQGTGVFVGKIMQEHAQKNKLELKGLDNGGMWIGQLERILILMFILFHVPTGIGFLIAAKSILRFSEAREEQKLAEYVLIGTFLSFGLAILLSFCMKHIFEIIGTIQTAG